MWDETRVLSAKVGEHILVARRSGREWYVGALTNWTPRDLDVDLSFLGAGAFEADIYRDGAERRSRGRGLRAREEGGDRRGSPADPPGAWRRMGGENHGALATCGQDAPAEGASAVRYTPAGDIDL